MAAACGGAVVGAGFATGQEVLTFFVVYGCREAIGNRPCDSRILAFGALKLLHSPRTAGGVV